MKANSIVHESKMLYMYIQRLSFVLEKKFLHIFYNILAGQKFGPVPTTIIVFTLRLRMKFGIIWACDRREKMSVIIEI